MDFLRCGAKGKVEGVEPKVCQQTSKMGSNSIPNLSQEYFVLYFKKENEEANASLATRSGGKANINLYGV